MRNGIVSMTAALAGAALAAGAPGQIEMETILLSGEPAPVGEPGVVFSNFIGGPLLASETGALLIRSRLGGEMVDSTNNVGLFFVSPEGEVSLVAREGDQAPGLPPNVRYGNLELNFLPAFNATGEIVFGAGLAGGGLVNGEDLGMLLAAWGPCSFPCGADLNRDGVVDGDDLGRMLGSWGVCPAPCPEDLSLDGVFNTNDSAIYTAIDGEVTLLMREGDEAPLVSTPETRLNGFTGVILNDQGTLGILAEVQIPKPGVEPDRFGPVSYLIRDGETILVGGVEEPAPGFPASTPFAAVGVPSLNSNDRMSFVGAVFDPDSGATAGTGIWSGFPNDVRLTVASGDPAPGTEPETVFDTPQSTPLQGSQGDILFSALLSGPSIFFGNDIGIWRRSGGALTLAARLSEPLPEIGEGVTLTGLETPIGDASGASVLRVEFVGPGVNTSNDLAVLAIEADNSRRLVARTGEQAPGAAPGQLWINFPFPPMIDAMGRAAFIGELTGPGVTSLNREGVWVVDRDGAARLIVRQGDIVEVAPGDAREVFAISALLSSDVDTGEPRGFEDNTIVFQLLFTDLTSAMMRVTLPAQIVPADLNGDGGVDGADLGALLGAWGPCEGACEADLNGDGAVDGADLGTLLGAWSGSQPAPSM